MWLFESLIRPGIKFHLLVDVDYQVGRKDCRIVISKDQSVSRKHALLRVSHPEANLGKPTKPSTVTLKDSSKFGTLVNGKQMDLGSSVALKHGDLVIFGASNSNKWKLIYKPLVVAFSSIPSSEKKVLKSLVLKLGGHVASEWSQDCTHLIMTQLSVTIKVTSALITCRPIVTPQYLHSIIDAAQNDKDMPKFSCFQPPVVEEAVDTKEVNFDPNPARSTLFKDKAFIFVAAKQMKQLGPTIELGGGKTILMEDGDKETFSSITKKDSIVMYADPEDASQAMTQETQDWIREVMMQLKRNGLRPIPVSELGLAVLYASTQLHCNPKVAQAGLNLLNAAPSQTPQQPQVLVSDTQSSCAKQSSSVKGQRSSTKQQKASTSTSSEDERSKTIPQSKKRERQDSAPEATFKIPKLEPPSPVPDSNAKSSKVNVAETPQKSSETPPSLPSLKTSPEFSFIGETSTKTAQPIKEEVITPERNNNKDGKGQKQSQGQRLQGQRSQVQRSQVVDDSEEKMDMDSEDDQSAAVATEAEPATKSKLGNKKRNKTATLDSVWDMEVGSRRRNKKVKEEAVIEEEKKEEEVIEEERIDHGGDEDVVKSEDPEEDSQNSMWKRKRKRNVLAQITADEERESQLSQDEDEGAQQDSTGDANPGGLKGFVTATKKEGSDTDHQIKSEVDGEPDTKTTTPYAMVSISAESLVIKRPKPKKTNNTAVISRMNGKNFKRFKKSGYAGHNRMPTIIGGRDLEEHTNKPNEEVDDMMFGGYQQQQRKAKDDELADRLFADEPRKQKPARGRRR